MFPDHFCCSRPCCCCLERIALFNCFVWDLCSSLWRSSTLPDANNTKTNHKASSDAHSNSILFTQLRPSTLAALQQYGGRVSKTLSLTHGAPFVGYSRDFLHSQGPNLSVRDDLRGKQKVLYLDYLKTRGLCGIYSFLVTFVASLANREQRRGRRHQQDGRAKIPP